MSEDIENQCKSFSSQANDSYIVYSDDLNSSQEIQKLKQRLYLKQSLLETFTNNAEAEQYYESQPQKQKINYNEMPAFLYTFTHEYVLIHTQKIRENLFHFYQQIILLSDVRVPLNNSHTIADSNNAVQKKQQIKSLKKINLFSQESIKKNIYQKIISYNLLNQSGTFRNNGDHQFQIQAVHKKFQESQLYIAMKLLFQQFKETIIFSFAIQIIGIIISLVCLFLLASKNNFNQSLAIYKFIIVSYYLFSLTLSLWFLYKSIVQGSLICIKLNTYFSYFALFISLTSFGLIFCFGDAHYFLITLTLQISYILLFLFNSVFSVKALNLYYKIEYLLGIKPFFQFKS